MFYHFDLTYLVLVLPAVIFAMWANASVNSTFRTYEKQYTARGITAAQVARQILDRNGLQHIAIEQVSGRLSDHYDPRVQVVRLSADVFHSSSTAAIGVAAHEVGHAIQHAQSYKPLKLRNAIIPVTNIGSKAAVPLLLLGFVLSALDPMLIVVAYVALACFALSTLFQLLTLPTEFNASKRALVCLEDYHMLSADELVGARKVLRAAAMTYVAALAVSLGQLLRIVLMVLGRDNNRR